MNWYYIDADGAQGFWGKATKAAIRSIAYELAAASHIVKVFRGKDLGKLQYTLVRENGMIEERS
jgi:hypothetical protein